MSLEIGSQLGIYKIKGPLGAGGMGAVYRAEDSRLDRDVAIKVLRDEMADDRDRVARFKREAKVLASLNHPMIAAIYGFDEAAGTHFIVLELVEGPTLADRLLHGRLDIKQSLLIAQQIAEALETAHESGIIHRDLKPANVKVTDDGRVKVLDFGLAKAMNDEESVSDDSETITNDFTAPGMIMGTAAYMSPEQARGKPVDKRTDIWSFGCVLYQCLTGHSAFRGETVTDSIGAILHKDPDWTRVPAETPPPIRLLLKRCLAKNRKQRLHDIADARLELETAVNDPDSYVLHSESSHDTNVRRSFSPFVATAAIGLVALTALVTSMIVGGKRSTPDASSSVSQRTISSVRNLTNLPGKQNDAHLSGDGRNIVFVSGETGARDIFLLRVGGQNPIQLTDAEHDDYDPAFSPDGDTIAFRSSREGGGLFTMGATGENQIKICDDGYEPTWSPDGKWIAYTTENVLTAWNRFSTAQLWLLSLETGEKRMLYKGDAVDPAFSPDGKRVAFCSSTDGVRDIWTIPVEGGDAARVTDDIPTDWNPCFSQDGTVLHFMSDRSGAANLWQVSFDASTGKATGKIRPVTTSVTGIDGVTFSADGRRFTATAKTVTSEILRYDFDSREERTVGEPKVLHSTNASIRWFDISPDGRRLVFTSPVPHEDLVVIDLKTSRRQQLTDDLHKDRGPVWVQDGSLSLFYSNRDGRYRIWRIRPNGTGLAPITAREDTFAYAVLSADGKKLYARKAVSAILYSVPLDRPIDQLESPVSPVPEDALIRFNPIRMSADGLHLAGVVGEGEGKPRVAVFNTQARELRFPPNDATINDGRTNGRPAWIDSKRVFYWYGPNAFVWDVESDEVRQQPGLPVGYHRAFIAEDQRAFYGLRIRSNEDIWLFEADNTVAPVGSSK